MPTTHRLSREGLAAGVLAGLTGSLTWPHVLGSLAAVTGPDFPAALGAVPVLTLAAVAAWILLVIGTGLAHVRLPGVPRSVGLLLFTSLVVATGSTAAHAESPHHDLDGLPLPDRPIVSSVVDTPPRATVTVRAGDTLWRLAAQTLGGRASDAEIARACRAWHRANLHVIGDDPDLILPGQVLTTPDPVSAQESA